MDEVHSADRQIYFIISYVLCTAYMMFVSFHLSIFVLYLQNLWTERDEISC